MNDTQHADESAPPSVRPTVIPHESPHHQPGKLHLASEDMPGIFIVHYTKDKVEEVCAKDIDECVPFLAREGVTWVDVRGISNTKTFERIGEIFNLHALALEDCTNVPQRPKTDTYADHQIIVARMATQSNAVLVTEQLSIVFGKGFVLTVQEEPETDCLDPLRHRLRVGRGSIRTLGADYLAYALVDAVVDGFYPILEHYGEKLEDLELEVAESRHHESKEIFAMKRTLLELRRAIWPMRDLLSSLMRDESSHISEGTRIYLRDTYDHVVQVMDIVESFREVASSLMDLFMTGISNRMNEIMKVLTILSTIFLPMTFIAGVYGMNFDREQSTNMPELGWKWGYVFSLFLMVGSAGSLLYYYYRRGWIGTRRKKSRRRK